MQNQDYYGSTFRLPPIFTNKISRSDLEKNTTNQRKPIRIDLHRSLFDEKYFKNENVCIFYFILLIF
jgi:hypothetical protein